MVVNPKYPTEIWAGLECKVNRVGEEYFDELERNGHARRLDDLELFAQLGIKKIRYPVLWERVAPDGLENADWSWVDVLLERLRELGITPIVGLVHHGSGPRDTSLVDPEFPRKLAEFPYAVSDRYSWVTHYMPINEPLTTARFSGMYGHWYPHGRDNLTFARALLVECQAIALSMQVIREVNPNAQLVQTEDLGKTYSTPKLLYQAGLENERRWLSFDLLCGYVTPLHPMWGYLRYCGISEAELEAACHNIYCPPDIMGINHYVTSERFLDERLENYPAWTHGGNGWDKYADVEAVRVCAESLAGPYTLLQEVWERYRLPLAVTEVHVNSTREEQLRWLYEVWNAAQKLQDEGVDIRAITAWSLLGSYYWNSLVTRSVGYYESGVFDLRCPCPRPTVIAKLVRDLACGHQPNHPLLDTPGWWHRPERLLYPAVSCENSRGAEGQRRTLLYTLPYTLTPSPLVIVGARGTLGYAFARLCEMRSITHHLLTRPAMDISNLKSVNGMLKELKPWAVVNAAGYVRVDDAEREPHICLKINTEGPTILATACAQHNAAMLTFSSDLVFNGALTNPYVESDIVAPLNVYGCSKVLAEKLVLHAYPASLVIRTSAFFGPWDEYNFVTVALRELSAGNAFVAAEDRVVSPTYIPDLVHVSLDLLIDGESGLWHLANKSASVQLTEGITWAELAKLAAKQAGISVSNLITLPMREIGLPAKRPTYSVLGSDRGQLMPCLDQAMSHYFDDKYS
jgi:dTDP-4-dehydrorhamnose reductase